MNKKGTSNADINYNFSDFVFHKWDMSYNSNNNLYYQRNIQGLIYVKVIQFILLGLLLLLYFAISQEEKK